MPASLTGVPTLALLGVIWRMFILEEACASVFEGAAIAASAIRNSAVTAIIL